MSPLLCVKSSSFVVNVLRIAVRTTDFIHPLRSLIGTGSLIEPNFERILVVCVNKFNVGLFESFGQVVSYFPSFFSFLAAEFLFWSKSVEVLAFLHSQSVYTLSTVN